MACFSQKNIGNIINAKQVLAAGATLINATDFATDSLSKIFVGIHLGREVVTALTAGVIFRVEGSMSTSGPGYWFPLGTFTSTTTLSETEAVSGAAAAGQKVLPVASTTNLAVGQVVFIRNAVVEQSEWGRIASLVVNTSITLEDNLVYAQTGSNIFNQAEFFSDEFDVSYFTRIRIVSVNAANATQASIP